METRRVTIEAKPGAVTIDLSRTAALVVDMQNDFGSKDGMLERAGIDIAPIRAAIAPIARVLAALRTCGVPVIYLKMAYRPDLSDLGPPGSPNRERHLRFSVGREVAAPDGQRSRILVRDTWNTDVVDELKPQSGDLELYKTRYSGFYATDLDAILRDRGVKYLIVTGWTTSVCVESTIRDAMFRDYSCVLLSDCAAEPVGADLPRTNHEASLHVLQAFFGWISDSGALLRALP